VLREQLAELMKELFAEQRDAEAKAIAALKQLRTIAPPAPAGAVPEPTVAPVPARSGGRMAVLAAVPLLVLAAALGGWLMLRAKPAPTPPAASAAAPAPDASVAIDVRTQPSVDATIKIGGRVVERRPARVKLAQSSDVVVIEVEADGYDATRLEVVPERDQFLVIPLTRSVVDASAKAEPSASAAAVSAVAPAATEAHTSVAPTAAVPHRPPVRVGARPSTPGTDLKKPPDW
jgi:hypothetical protein